jgi:predicted HTH transcriptional regulator
MKLPWEWDESDVQSLVDSQVQENAELEYKACAALDRTEERRNEVSKDVSAFANAGGGVIIYGVLEVIGVVLEGLAENAAGHAKPMASTATNPDASPMPNRVAIFSTRTAN